jgi:hypothetical protein
MITASTTDFLAGASVGIWLVLIEVTAVGLVRLRVVRRPTLQLRLRARWPPSTRPSSSHLAWTRRDAGWRLSEKILNS